MIETDFKNYYFQIRSIKELARLEELQFSLDSLDIEYHVLRHYVTDHKTKRAMMYDDVPPFIIGRLYLTPIYEKPSLLEEQVRNWVVEAIAFRVYVHGLDESTFKDLDEFIKLFIENNFRE